jgi:hypothetical protein
MMEKFKESALKQWRLRWAYRAFVVSAKRGA